MPAAVDEERRRARDAAGVGAGDVFGDAGRVLVTADLIPESVEVEAEVVGDPADALRRERALIGEQRANLLDVQHIREGVDLHVRETAVQLVLETRSHAHLLEVTDAIRTAGYPEPQVFS